MNLKDEWNKTGYNQEELYFEKVNRDLIQKLKTQKTPSPSDAHLSMAQVIPFRPKSDTALEQKKKAA